MSNAREWARNVWQSGVNAVRAETLIAQQVHCQANRLVICDSELTLDEVGKICVVGAGKAAGYLASELVRVLRPVAQAKQLHGLVNVPANCVVPLDHVQLHAARPANINEPRPEGVIGTQRMLQLVSALQPNDLCICLITGGGSALLPAPKPPITLQDKLQVTKLLSARGASIQELNRVRIALSDVKGGGLLRHCRAHRLITLIVSDVIGDPLDLIASGPTIAMPSSEARPLEILKRHVDRAEVSTHVWDMLSNWSSAPTAPASGHSLVAEHHLLANNAMAVQAARESAEAYGLKTLILPPESTSTTAETVGMGLVDQLAQPIEQPCCILWGGEPVVQLQDEPGKGGRNQQVALTVASQWERVAAENRSRICVLSGGTDGEDGPTDAAGALVDERIVQEAVSRGLHPQHYLSRNDAYSFFEPLGGLIKTGPTHTNVCDLRVAVRI